MAEEKNQSNTYTEDTADENDMHHTTTVSKTQQPQPSISTNPYTACPQSTTSQPLPITDLVNEPEITATAPTLDLTSLQTSKHHPDFRIRNQHKLLKLATILSDLNLHLSAAHRAQDQAAFDALHARICQAGDGLPSLAQAMPAKKGDGVRRLSGGEMCDVNRSMRGSEWYRVEHGGLVEEGEGHDALSAGRVQRAREVYEASLCRGEGEIEAAEEGEWPEGREWQDESQETTLVEGVGVGGGLLLHPAIEVALD